MRHILRWIWLGILLGGCTSSHLTPVCPTLIDYTKEDQKALVEEMIQSDDKPETVRWIGDYIGLRDQVRACQKY